MRFLAYLKPENGLLGRGFGAWLDHADAGRASRFVLTWFVILYTLFAIISAGALGLRPELLETYVLGLHPAAGYAGHAPLAPWIAGAWFRLFQPVDWAFYLLAMINAAVGLFAADRIAGQYLTGDKRIAVLLLLLLTPFWQFMGQRFGDTAIMLSTWPVATWCFLRAFATRDPAWSAAAGAAAALAVLGNYASVFLIAGFIVAVLLHPTRGVFLRSWAPWIALATGAMVLAPHLRWLFTTGLIAPGEAAPLADALRNGVIAIAASLAAVGAVLVAWGIAVRPGRAVLRETLRPADPGGRMLVILLVAPLALQFLAAPLLAASSAGGALPLSWSAASTWFLLPVVLLRPKAAVLTRTAAIRITALVAAVTIATLACAPWLGSQGYTEETAQSREYYRLIGTEVTKSWHLTAARPLRVVTGDPQLTAAVAFYSPDRPDPVPDTGAAPAGGYAAVCRTGDEACVAAAKHQAEGKANAQFITYSTISRSPGKPGRLERFFFVLVPPPGSIAPPPIDIR